jgi:hypothetical protein
VLLGKAGGIQLAANSLDNDPFCSSNFHRFISSDVHMTLLPIPKSEYWNLGQISRQF